MLKETRKEALKQRVQKELRRMVKEAKTCYKKKMEDQLQQNDISGDWRGVKTPLGYRESSRPDSGGGLKWAKNNKSDEANQNQGTYH